MLKGSCECGQVQFELHGDLREVVACHCNQCRKTSGHYWAATSLPTEALKLTRDEGLKWFRSSDFARRGFCTGCGASLFYEMDGEERTSVAAGALDRPTGLAISKHIFVKDKGDYYEIADGLAQFEIH